MPETLSVGEFLRGGLESPMPNPGAVPDRPGLEQFLSERQPDREKPRSEQNFFERMGANVERRKAMIQEIAEAEVAGEQSFAESVAQISGKFGAGLVLDTLGEVLVSGARGVSTLTPDIIENPIKDGAAYIAHDMLNSPGGRLGLKAAEKGLESWVEWRENNPRMGRHIESVVNIGLLAAPVKKSAPRSGPRTAAGRAGQRLQQSAARSEARSHARFADDLVRPHQTVSQRINQVRSTTERGPLRIKRAALSPVDNAAAREVERVAGVRPSNSLQGNFSAIHRAVGQEADRLAQSLRGSGATYGRQQFDQAMDAVIAAMPQNPVLVGNGRLAAERVVEQMKTLAAQNGNGVAGLLNARKQLDRWIRSQKGGNVFDPALENALTIAIRETRQATNTFIARAAPRQNVLTSLRKQANLFRAMDNIAPKAAREANNVLLRAWRRTLNVLPLRGEFNQLMALAFGIGGLGAAAVFAPYFTKLVALTGITYVGGRAVLSPASRKGLGALLKGVDRAIAKTSDSGLIRQLRLDRAAVVELLQDADVSEEIEQ